MNTPREIVAAQHAHGCSQNIVSAVLRDIFHGAGDVFSSALLGALLNKKDIKTAVDIALDLTVGSIKRTYAAQTDTRFGLDFEHGLGDYAHRVSSR